MLYIERENKGGNGRECLCDQIVQGRRSISKSNFDFQYANIKVYSIILLNPEVVASLRDLLQFEPCFYFIVPLNLSGSLHNSAATFRSHAIPFPGQFARISHHFFSHHFCDWFRMFQFESPSHPPKSIPLTILRVNAVLNIENGGFPFWELSNVSKLIQNCDVATRNVIERRWITTFHWFIFWCANEIQNASEF
jgi:hypothetical protein